MNGSVDRTNSQCRQPSDRSFPTARSDLYLLNRISLQKDELVLLLERSAKIRLSWIGGRANGRETTEDGSMITGQYLFVLPGTVSVE